MLKLNDRHYLLIFIIPSLILLVVLTLYPLFYSLKISFYGWDLIKPESVDEFVMFKNYMDVLRSSDFWSAIIVTMKFTFYSVISEIIIGAAFAFLLFQNLKGTSIVRTLVITAMIMTPVMVGTLWRLMYNPGWGIINYILDVIGIGGRPFLSEKKTVIGALVIVDIWQWSPLVMLILLASLQNLPEDIFEAAMVDGASRWQIFWHITIPFLTPSLLLALLIRLMDCFRTFDTIFAMTGGGPGIASQNLNILMYNVGFEFFQISKASSIAIISLFIIVMLSIVMLRLFRREEMVIW